MTERSVALYCFFDDFLRVTRPVTADKRRQVGDAEVLMTGAD